MWTAAASRSYEVIKLEDATTQGKSRRMREETQDQI
jgi:hypothetical protein